MNKKWIMLASLAFVFASCANESGSQEVIPSVEEKHLITLTSNHEGDEVSILHPGIQKYVDDMYAAEEQEGLTEEERYGIRQLCSPGVVAVDYQGPSDDKDRDNFEDVVLTFDTSEVEATSFVVEFSTNEDMSDAKTVQVEEPTVSLTNLYCDTTYYWRVKDSEGTCDSAIGSFHTKGPFRNISTSKAYNVRDIGGKMTHYGRRVKQGVAYRGAELVTEAWGQHSVTLDEEDIRILYDDLHIRTEFDFRKNGSDSNNQNASFIADDVTFVREGCGSLSGFFTSGDPAMLKHIFTTIGAATEENAIYFHCWGGADRTGTVAFLMEALLGVSYVDICMDYEFTSFDNGAHTRRRDVKVESYDFPAFIKTIMNSKYYEEGKFLSDIIEDWMIDYCGMTSEEIVQIRDNLLE